MALEFSRKHLYLGAVLAASSILSACNSGSNTPSSQIHQVNATLSSATLNKIALRNQLLKDNYEVPVQVGDGFDGRTGMDRGVNCLVNADDPTAITFSSPQGSIDFSDTVDISQAANLLNTSIQGTANFGLFSASVAANYIRDSMDTRQSLNFNYLQTMAVNASYKFKGLGNNILSSDAQNLLAGGMDDFTSVCGDSVIQNAKEGAALLVDVSINFASNTLKQQFSGSASGSIAGIGSIVGAFSNNLDNITKNATLSIKAYQMGGDPTKLAKIFGNPNPSGQYNVVNCALVDDPKTRTLKFDACQNLINNIINYAQNDFQTSVNFKDLSTLYTYQYNSKPYTQLGVKANLPVLTADEQAARNYLSTTITQDRAMLSYLEAYQKQPFFAESVSYIDAMTRQQVLQAIKDYSVMITNYNNYDIVDSCYGDIDNINTRCVYAESQVQAMRQQYTASINVANGLSGTIGVYTQSLGEFWLLSARGWNLTNANSEVADGYFLAIDPISGNVLSDCSVDTTLNSSYFSVALPNLVGKSIQCYATVLGANGYYVKNSATKNITGIAGQIINGQPVDFPISATNVNSSFVYSDASNFEYNPI